MVATTQKEKLIEQIQKVEDERLWQEIELLLMKFDTEHQQREQLLTYVTSISKGTTDIEAIKKEQNYRKMTLERWNELTNNIGMDDPIEEIEMMLAL